MPGRNLFAPDAGQSPAGRNLFADQAVNTQAAGQAAQRSWADVPGEAAQNAIPSAINFGKSIAQAVTHPIDTAQTAGAVVAGAAAHATQGVQTPTFDKLRNPKFAPPPVDTSAADTVGKFYTERYGSMDGLKSALATDPVGVMADFAAFVPALSPASVAARGATTAARLAEPVVSGGLGVTTGAGGTAVRTAARVGVEGTPAERAALTGQMRGTADRTQPLDQAREALDRMRQQRGADYQTEMTRLNADRTPLDFAPVQQALSQTIDSAHTVAGTIKLDAADQAILDRVINTVAEWERNPAEHTVNGLDGLKQRIQGIYPNTDNTQASRIVGNVSRSVRDIIAAQAPEYAQVMDRYAADTGNIDNVRRTLSLGDNATEDTALRKLQSVMRDGVQTNYGQRMDLVNQLEQHGGEGIRPGLAGQSLSAAAPRGLARMGAEAGAVYSLVTNPKLALALPLTSPRLVGEGAYLAGNAARGVRGLAAAIGAPRARAAELGLFQSGRAEDQKLRALAAALNNH